MDKTYDPTSDSALVPRPGTGTSPWTYVFLVGLMAFYVVLQMASINYGFHRDELYYIIMSQRLDFGYLELPALAPFLLSLVRAVLGTTLASVHLLPALSGAALIFITFRMAKELGGGGLAAILAAVATALAPQYIGSDSIYSYDYLDKLAWVLALYFLLLYFKRGAERYLCLFGLAMGLGLLSKVSIVFLGAVFLAALALTGYRKLFARPTLYTAGGLAFVFVVPYLIWQTVHHWPTLEFYGHYASGKTYPYTLLESFFTQVLNMNPLTLPLWATGLVFFWTKDKGRYRPLTLMYVFLFGGFYAIQAKSYMIAPFYTVLYAGGAVVLIGEARRAARRWAGVAYAVLIALLGVYVAPRARPLLPVEAYLRYAHGRLGFRQERLELRDLPQHFADRFGWPEFVDKCREVYESLPPEDKKEAVFLTANYGEASAINFYGTRFGLPEALSGHNQYYLWGPRGHSGRVVIVFRMGSREDLLNYFDSVAEAARTEVKHAMPYESGQPIFVCRGIKIPLALAWPKCKSFG
jgi:hypothetical protein